MNTNDERIRILTLVQDGSIGVNEATELLRALDLNANGLDQADSEADSPASVPRLLRILKTNELTHQTLADITIPLDLLKAGMRVGANFYLDLAGLSPAQLDLLVSSPQQFVKKFGSNFPDFCNEETNESIHLSLV